jgi:adenylate cyclase
MAAIDLPNTQEESGPHTWARRPIAAWLADHRGGSIGAQEMFSGFCERLVAEGIQLHRVSLNLQDAHPQIAGRGFFWVREKGLDTAAYDFQGEQTPGYLESPIRVIREGGEGLRRRLAGEGVHVDFPVLNDLKAAGATDFVAMPLVFADGSRQYISFTTDQPDGFTTEELTQLYDLIPLFGLRVELEHARYTSQTLMETYLGRQAARRVLAGAIRRGEGESIKAIVLFADLRNFTRLVSQHTPDDVVDTLSLYYEALAGPVGQFGGDIVKMMGDGLLAIFPVDAAVAGDDLDRTACGAVAAVKLAAKNLGAIPADKLPEGVDHLRAGFALHYGEITFGNIGSLDRLDFTVIGPAVNEAVRAEQLTKKLELPLVATDSFANLDCDITLRSLGFHVLRGVPQPVEIFTPEENVVSDYSS